MVAIFMKSYSRSMVARAVLLSTQLCTSLFSIISILLSLLINQEMILGYLMNGPAFGWSVVKAHLPWVVDHEE